MERLLIDQDGVLADSMGSVFSTIMRESGVELCHADTTDYWFAGMEVEPDHILDIMRRPGFFLGLDVITGAKLAINRLRKDYEVVVCTAPLKGSFNAEEEKRIWLADHFDEELARTAIVTSDKSSVEGKVLVEDNPHIDRNAQWMPIMFDQPWNRHVEDLPVMYGWGDLDMIKEYM